MFSDIAMEILKARYLRMKPDGTQETPEDMFMRVAKAIGKTEEEVQEFYDVMASLDFLPNSPTLMNAGVPNGQLSACFVLPVEDNMESIFEAVKQAALIHKSGGGTGFSFSSLRPSSDTVGSTGGVASGPVSFMRVFNVATDVVKQGGKRRGANMSVLNVSHPDIEQFIHCKDKEGEFSNFNISVGITDTFMQCVKDNGTYTLWNPNSSAHVNGHLTVRARDLMHQIAEAAWKTGEPGVIFLDTMNKYNPTPELGSFEATNPCGEQPLLPYESCNLGSINLANMVEDGSINYEKLANVTRIATKFLDRVIDVNRFPNERIKEATLRTRKIGIGVMGFADMLVKLKIPYDSDGAEIVISNVMSFIYRHARKESEGKNKTLTTIAPTGTLSLIAGVNSGIEPFFSLAYGRKNALGEGTTVNPYLEDALGRVIPKRTLETGSIQDAEGVSDEVKEIFKTSHEIPWQRHIKVQAAFQDFTDNAVSKTINMSNSATVEDIEAAYMMAWEMGCKGITVYRDGCRKQQVYNVGNNKVENKVYKRGRPVVTKGTTRKIKLGCGRTLYATVNKDEDGLCEAFLETGKSGGCIRSHTEAEGRLISLALRSGISEEEIVEQLSGIRCDSPAFDEDGPISSCADAIARAISLSNGDTYKARVDLTPECPECGGKIEMRDGCMVCSSCGFSRCG